MEKKFTIAQIRKYLEFQDSRGDIYYNLSEENIEKANNIPLESENDDEWNFMDPDFDPWEEEIRRELDFDVDNFENIPKDGNIG